MTLTKIISEAPTKELLRAFKSSKQYLQFNVSVFNVGAVIHIKCTDIYKEINYNTWNGYDSIHENDYLINEIIEQELKNRNDEKQTKN